MTRAYGKPIKLKRFLVSFSGIVVTELVLVSWLLFRGCYARRMFVHRSKNINIVGQYIPPVHHIQDQHMELMRDSLVWDSQLAPVTSEL